MHLYPAINPNDKSMHMYTLTYDSRDLKFAIDDNNLETIDSDRF